MAFLDLLVGILAVLLCGVFHIWIIKPIFLSPLRRIPPAHWSSSASRLWVLSKRLREQDTPAVHEAHSRLGPVVRLAPNELSVNSPEGVRAIYGGSFPKNDWYANVFSNFGTRPMFAMSGNEVHGKRKRALGNVYTKSTLLSSPALEIISREVVDSRLMPRLREYAKTGEAVEFYDVTFGAAMDYITAYLFGLRASCDLTSHPDVTETYRKSYKTRIESVFLPQELTRLTRWMRKLGLLRLFLPASSWDSEAWVLDMQDKAEQIVQIAEETHEHVDPGDWPTVYSQLRSSLLRESKELASSKQKSTRELLAISKLEIASEMVDHTFAGFDTGSMVLLYLAYEISKIENLHWQDILRAEANSKGQDCTSRILVTLPVLHAVIMETLRLHAPVPGNSVRVSPSDRAVVMEVPGQERILLPPNIRIHAQAWSLHRNPSAFPNPEKWDPSRWLESDAAQWKEMHRWFWAFGSGSRMCAGNSFGMLELKRLTASIWKELRTEIVDERGMVHNGGFLAGPLGHNESYLKLRFKAM